MFIFCKLKLVLTLLIVLINKTNLIFVPAKSLLFKQFPDWKRLRKIAEKFYLTYLVN